MRAFIAILGMSCVVTCNLSFAQSELSEDGKTQKEFRFEFREVSGKLYRMDRMTGAVEEIGGAREKVVELSSTRSDRTFATQPALPTANATNRAPVIKLEQEVAAAPQKSAVPLEITEVHRQEAEPELRSYLGKLGVIQTIHISGDRLTGWVTVRNNGEREIKALELTIRVPIGEDRFQSYPIVMGYHPGQIAPPQPSNNEASPAQAQVMKVDYPAPAVVKGKIDIKPSYIKFAD